MPERAKAKAAALRVEAEMHLALSDAQLALASLALRQAAEWEEIAELRLAATLPPLRSMGEIGVRPRVAREMEAAEQRRKAS